MQRFTTGVEALDTVLAGGLPAGSLTVVAGSPGTGKTILSQQIAFANATDERPARYYTTLSESHAKLVRHLDVFDFFDREAIDGRVQFLHVADLVADADPGLERLIDALVEEAFLHNPSVVVVDSAKALHHVADPDRLRNAVYALASRVGHTGAALVLVGEYTSHEVATTPECAVADAIIELANDADGPVDRRWLRVVKMRGSDYLPGRHTFRIGVTGFEVFPRLETLTPASVAPGDGRAAFDVDEVDAMTGGGLPRGDAAVVMGPAGSGKTALALHWTRAGLRAGESCLYVTLEETVEELIGKATAFGLDLEHALESGHLRVVPFASGGVEIDEVGGVLRRHVADLRPERVVVDALGDVLPAAIAADRNPSYLWALATTMRQHGAAVLFTWEAGTLGSGHSHAVSYLFHDVLVLRYMERNAELRRVLTVLKMRRSAHHKNLLQYDITDRGFTPTGVAGDVTGILGWTVYGSPTGT